MIDFKKVQSAYFVGIGGIGISAIARMMLLEGKKVVGSDRSRSLITDELEKVGAKIFVGHNEDNIPKDCDLVIYTIAIPKENPELIGAQSRGIPLLSYPEALGIISKDKFTIAISGTHGKTTTTAMVGKMMIDAGLDPTVIVGSLMNDTRSNFIVGQSKYLVVESCEYHRSFLNIQPKIIVITNIDNDHLDYYKDLADIQSAFLEFAVKLSSNDYLITDIQHKNIKPILQNLKCKTVDYQSFGDIGPKLKLRVLGKHNIENAKAAMAVAHVLGISEQIAVKSLNDFSGTWRRFEYKGKTKLGAHIYDDYGHHPTEIKATLRGAREHFVDQKIVAIFQPHLYSRTKLLLDEFATSFNDADELILLPIYAAREAEDKEISSQILAKAVTRQISKSKNFKLKNVTVAHDQSEAISLIPTEADIILTIGAGDVTNVSDVSPHTSTPIINHASTFVIQ
ncbi:MAG: UDP-N-acetylmuramate--L-alanine ligase [Candidatus Vogelbacteria bacterium]|nr:UDP-N-acetylmuramate--L-alanine ligase [Candidatus Vogelbacteria bacterium]